MRECSNLAKLHSSRHSVHGRLAHLMDGANGSNTIAAGVQVCAHNAEEPRAKVTWNPLKGRICR